MALLTISRTVDAHVTLVLKYILLVIKVKRGKKVLELYKLPKNFRELLELQLLILGNTRTLKSERSIIEYCSRTLKR